MAIIFIPFVLVQAILHGLVYFISKIFNLELLALTSINHLIALDKYANSILGGHYNQTISHRLGVRMENGCKASKVACSILDCFDEGHCQKSIERD